MKSKADCLYQVGEINLCGLLWFEALPFKINDRSSTLGLRVALQVLEEGRLPSLQSQASGASLECVECAANHGTSCCEPVLLALSMNSMNILFPGDKCYCDGKVGSKSKLDYDYFVPFKALSCLRFRRWLAPMAQMEALIRSPMLQV